MHFSPPPGPVGPLIISCIIYPFLIFHRILHLEEGHCKWILDGGISFGIGGTICASLFLLALILYCLWYCGICRPFEWNVIAIGCDFEDYVWIKCDFEFHVWWIGVRHQWAPRSIGNVHSCLIRNSSIPHLYILLLPFSFLFSFPFLGLLFPKWGYRAF